MSINNVLMIVTINRHSEDRTISVNNIAVRLRALSYINPGLDNVLTSQTWNT